MSLYDKLKGQAYSALATCGMDHKLAQSKDFKDGWQMLIHAHDSHHMPLFLNLINETLSEKQRQVLLDGLADEYTEHSNWLDYVDRCCNDNHYRPNAIATPPPQAE